MYLLIVFLPLLSSLATNLFANYISKKGGILISVISIILTAILSFFIFYEIVLCQSICNVRLFP